MVKNLPADEGDVRHVGSVAGFRRSPREGNGNPCLYSCLENPKDIGAWWATDRGAAESRTEQPSAITYGRQKNNNNSFLFFPY